MTPIKNCKLVQLPKISDPRGNLTFVESDKHIPFKIQRAYYLYDIPGGSDRGGHAHKKLQQLMIALSGSFDVHLDSGLEKSSWRLDRPYIGLLICPMVWRTISNFSSGAVCLVLASMEYDENDYYREYDEFIKNAS